MANPVFALTLGGLNVCTGVYSLEKSSFGSRSVAWRKTEVSNRWVEGAFPTSAVRENVKESVSVWVEGATHDAMDVGVQAICAVVKSLSWQAVYTVDDVAYTFSCQPSDYSIDTTQEYVFARTALVKIDVDRLPRVHIVSGTRDVYV